MISFGFGKSFQKLALIGAHSNLSDINVTVRHRDLGKILFADGFAQEVGFAQVEPSERMGDGHELLLIDHDAEGVVCRLVAPIVVYRSYFAATEADVVFCCSDIERCRAVQGIDGDHVLDAVRPYVLNEARDTR